MPDDPYMQSALEVVREAMGDRSAEVHTKEAECDCHGQQIDVVPRNSSACPVSILPTGHQIDLWLGYDSVVYEIWQERHEERLENLRQCLIAVVAGRYEERWHQKRLPWRHTQFVGTFHTDDGDIVFTVQGGEPDGLELERQYAPY